jgi:Bacterial Ig-like domain
MSGIDSISAGSNSFDGKSLGEIDREIRDELRFHLEMRTEDNLRLGMTPADARISAEERFGNFRHIHQSCRKALLGERIMLQRLQTGLIVILLLAVVALGFQMYSAQRASQAALADVAASLARLNSAPVRETMSIPAGSPPEWAADRPRVVETFPANDATDVDPETSEIRVTFNKPMANGSWSWVRSSPESFPEATGDVHYLDDMKTCVMPVQLEPSTKYVAWFNSANYQNFKDQEGRPAVPHLLTFTTRK